VYRVWIALAAVLGFVVGSAATFLIGIAATGGAECDGPCFSKWDEVSYVSYAVGVLTAIGFGVVARNLLRRYFAKPS
jgi:hypothetical protein